MTFSVIGRAVTKKNVGPAATTRVSDSRCAPPITFDATASARVVGRPYFGLRRGWQQSGLREITVSGFGGSLPYFARTAMNAELLRDHIISVRIASSVVAVTTPVLS